METHIKIINPDKQLKLIKSLPKYFKKQRKALEELYGVENTERITTEAIRVYPEIVQVLPTFHSTMYDSLMVVASRLAALKKGMKAAGLSTEEFVKLNIEQTRSKAEKTPKLIRRLVGKIYISRPMRSYLGGVAKTITKNGWPTKLIKGSKRDDFVMSIETRNCQMVAFFETIGEGDIRPYCTFFDFTSAEALGIGLKQVSDINSGVCKYCFNKNGHVQWPDSIEQMLNENKANSL